LIGVGKDHLIQINKSLKTKGLVERLHGNTKRIPNTKNRTKIDQTLLPHIKIITPGTDLCETCKILKAEIRSANYNKEKELIQKRLDDHKQKAAIEREYYRNNILT
ncbi:34889_t:CDS:2, partial [Racocetra persica]